MPVQGVVDYSALNEEQLMERADTQQRLRRLIATASPRADVIRAPIHRLYRSLDETYRLGGSRLRHVALVQTSRHLRVRS
jgi:hypothetical protein